MTWFLICSSNPQACPPGLRQTVSQEESGLAWDPGRFNQDFTLVGDLVDEASISEAPGLAAGFTGEVRIAAGSGAAQDYQMSITGFYEFRVAGGGEQVWADGYQGSTLTEVKYVGNPAKSPFTTGIKPEIQEVIDAKMADELGRYAAVIGDPESGFTSLRIVTNSEDAVPYFEGMTADFTFPVVIDVIP